MGYGRWDHTSFVDYSNKRGRTVDASGKTTGTYSNQDIFHSRTIDPMLNPKNVMRECCDSEEHPNTLPVILALDVTGSMGQTAVEVAKQLNIIMTKLYEKVTDVEFLVMGIGDLEVDQCPIQISQFESDIRIADQLERIYFEFGGGGNNYESYTAAWYMASRHTKLDAWKRGKKGILITMGDETLNPYLPRYGRRSGLVTATGDNLQDDVNTKDLYQEVKEKYDVYHLNVKHRTFSMAGIESSFRKYLNGKHFRNVNMDNIADEIVDIITNASENKESISWTAGISAAADSTVQDGNAPKGIMGKLKEMIAW